MLKIHCDEHVLDILARPDIKCWLLLNDVAVSLVATITRLVCMPWTMLVSEMLGPSVSTHIERSTVTTELISSRTLIRDTDETLWLSFSLPASGA